MKKILQFDDLNKLFQLVAREYTIFSPQLKDGTVVLDIKTEFDEYCLYRFQTVLPPKNIFLSPVYDLASQPQSKKIAIFGIHLCDVKSINQLDDIFKNDPNYQSNRQNSLIIATGCQPTASCFCHILEANKHHGFDLFIQQEKNQKYVVFAKSELGVKVLQNIKAPISLTAKYSPIGHSGSPANFDKLSRIINQKKLYQDKWQAIANNCFGCGACTAVCPLCFCFDVIDRTDPKNGFCHRCRVEDACFFNQFSQISNHDYRPNNVDRLYNWYHHKFVRHFIKTKEFLCVGCGRCILACPANLNIKTILSELDDQFQEKS